MKHIKATRASDKTNMAEPDTLRKSLDTLLLISEVTSGSLFSDQVFQQVMDTILNVTGFESIHFRLHDSQKCCLRVAAGRGLPPELMPQFECFPDDHGIPGIAFQTQQPVYTSNLSTDERRAIHPLLSMEWESLVAVPLMAGDLPIGTMQLASPQPREWSEVELRWLASIGRQVGMIVHHAQLVERLRDQSVLQERSRLGQEIHDNLAQAVGYLTIQSKLAYELLSEGKLEQAQTRLQEVKQTSQTIYDDVRALLFDLRALITPGAGFLQEFRTYLDEFQSRFGIKTHLIVEDEKLLEMPSFALIHVTRIIQEALTNIRKHARAKHAWVSFEQEGFQTRVEIADDGVGFDPNGLTADNKGGYGIKIMGERAESIGGQIRFDTHCGSGTQVVVMIPLNPRGI